MNIYLAFIVLLLFLNSENEECLIVSVIIAFKVSDASQSFRGGANGVYRQHAYSGIKEVLSMAYKEAGPRGLYRGIGKKLTQFACINV